MKGLPGSRPSPRRAGAAAAVRGALGLALALTVTSGSRPATADPELVQPDTVFDFGAEWDYLDGSVVLEPGWARELTGERSVPEAWLPGTSPFIGRSTVVEREISAERRRARRRARRRGRSAPQVPFDGTLLLYDSETFLSEGAPGPEAGVEPGPNVFYFERTFEISNLEEVVSTFFEARFSGGFVAYLNGREWLRHNVDLTSPPDAPADIVWQPTWVAQTVSNVWQRAFVGLDPGLLVEGENVLSIEVHRRGTGGRRALFFDAQMRTYREHGFIRTPYLQRVTPDSITVMWQTTAPAVGYVEFGAGEWLERVATSPRETGTLQQVTLTGLEPDTRYFYRVHSVGLGDTPDEITTVSSPIYHFRSAVEPGQPFNFMLYGDNRTQSSVHARLIREMRADAELNDARFFLNTGDLTTNASWWDEWQTEFFEPALPMLSSFPLYAVLGNHEGNHESYYEYLEHPGNEAWYSFTYGDAELFALNTSTVFSPGSEQYLWIERELAASTATWKIVFFHHPPFSCVPIRKPGNPDVIEYLVPLFEQYGVNLVLLGHDHLYGRSVPVNGVVYVTSGGGGAYTYPAEPDDINEICVQTHHYCILRVSASSLELEAVSIEGELLDRFVLEP